MNMSRVQRYDDGCQYLRPRANIIRDLSISVQRPNHSVASLIRLSSVPKNYLNIHYTSFMSVVWIILTSAAMSKTWPEKNISSALLSIERDATNHVLAKFVHCPILFTFHCTISVTSWPILAQLKFDNGLSIQLMILINSLMHQFFAI